MAEVYRVRHLGLGTLHALKVVARGGEAIARRLRNEGQVQARLSHPHIVGVRDVLKVRDRDALVLDYVRGPDLGMCLEQPLPEAEALIAFRAVAAAVAHAHAHGVVHRDLKPGNVLLALPQLGAPLLPMVADFGLVKSLLDDMGLSAHTRTGIAMGTPAYMSPEQVANAKDVDRRADIWSLGCVLYVMVTGREAFAAPNLIALFYAIGTGTFQPFDEAPVPVSDRIQQAVRAMLHPDLSDRAVDVVDVVEFLDGRRDSPLRAIDGDVLPAARDASEILGPTTLAPDSELATRARAAYEQSAGLQNTAIPPTTEATWAESRPDGPVPAPSSDRPRWAIPLVVGILLLGTAFTVGAVTTALRPAPSAAPAPAPARMAAPEPPPVAAPTEPLVPPQEPAPPAAQAAPAPSDDPPPSPAPAPASSRPPAPAPAAPAERPSPAPAPDAAPPTATVVVDGAAEVVLQAPDGQRFAPGAAPAGTYLVLARFDPGASLVPSGQVAIPASGVATLQCDRVMHRCAIRPAPDGG